MITARISESVEVKARPAADVTIIDTDVETRRATFTYAYSKDYSDLYRLISLKVYVHYGRGMTPDRGPEGDLALTGLRQMPLGGWERVARAKMAEWYRKRQPARPRASVPASDEKLVSVAEHYRESLRKGVRDPSAAIAREYGVKPQTARYWVLKARQLGILGPAAGTRPGEAGAPQELEANREAPQEKAARSQTAVKRR